MRALVLLLLLLSHTVSFADFCERAAEGGPVPTKNAQLALGIWQARVKAIESVSASRSQFRRGFLRMEELPFNGGREAVELIAKELDRAIENPGGLQIKEKAVKRLKEIRKAAARILEKPNGPEYGDVSWLTDRFVREIRVTDKKITVSPGLAGSRLGLGSIFPWNHFETMVPTARELSIRDLNDVSAYPLYFAWVVPLALETKDPSHTFDGSSTRDHRVPTKHDQSHAYYHYIQLLLEAGVPAHSLTGALVYPSGSSRSLGNWRRLMKTVKEREEFYWAFREYSSQIQDAETREAMEVLWFEGYHELPIANEYSPRGLLKLVDRIQGRETWKSFMKRLSDKKDLGGAVAMPLGPEQIRKGLDALEAFARAAVKNEGRWDSLWRFFRQLRVFLIY